MPRTLLKEIEKCRTRMIELSKNNAFTSYAVIKASEELDTLLNQLHSKQQDTINLDSIS